jgi:hypothetical protein
MHVSGSATARGDGLVGEAAAGTGMARGGQARRQRRVGLARQRHGSGSGGELSRGRRNLHSLPAREATNDE